MATFWGINRPVIAPSMTKETTENMRIGSSTIKKVVGGRIKR